jgi:NAD(P)H-hydrate epimerase
MSEAQPAGALALLTVDQMSQADQAAVAAGMPGVKLMENAGRAVAEAIFARWQPRPVLVLAGPGNNGGDGFVAARHLAQAGWPVRLALLGARENLTGDAARHAALWDDEVLELSPDLVDSEELVIDALFGAGLSRPLEGPARAAIETAGATGGPLVAVDVPSGLSGDSGAVLGPVAARADLTVTFFRKKPGHLLLPGRTLCGEVVVADIGIPEGVLEQIAPRAMENGPELWLDSLPRRKLVDHKYCFGHAVVLGGATMTGAARLAARAALRVGAGLVSVACPPDVLPIYALASASLITEPLAREGDFAALLADRRKNAVLVGPGAGVNTKTRGHALVALGAGKAVVLDADALTVFAESPDDLFKAIKGPCVLTPHEGEFARLFPDLKGDKLERTRAAAERSGATVLLKGADTVIARPDGLAAINANAPPSLAVAGAGDVLAGLVLGLLAQGMAPFEAATAAAWLHGAAAATRGPGLLAEDLPEALPRVLRQLV